jgi:hypothetical protein
LALSGKFICSNFIETMGVIWIVADSNQEVFKILKSRLSITYIMKTDHAILMVIMIINAKEQRNPRAIYLPIVLPHPCPYSLFIAISK